MSHTTRLAFLGKGASFLAIFLVQLLVVYLVVTVTGNRRPSIYILNRRPFSEEELDSERFHESFLFSASSP